MLISKVEKKTAFAATLSALGLMLLVQPALARTDHHICSPGTAWDDWKGTCLAIGAPQKVTPKKKSMHSKKHS